MFEVGAGELCVVLVIGVLVLGPERLPRVARMLGALWALSCRSRSTVTHHAFHAPT